MQKTHHLYAKLLEAAHSGNIKLIKMLEMYWPELLLGRNGILACDEYYQQGGRNMIVYAHLIPAYNPTLSTIPSWFYRPESYLRASR